MDDIQLSLHYKLSDCLASQKAKELGIDNSPENEIRDVIIENLRALCNEAFELILAHFGKLHLESVYRCPEVNIAVGGTVNPPSQHMKGEAADLWVPGVDHNKLYNWIYGGGVDFDQVIREYPPDGWVHVSHRRNGNRKVGLLKQKGVPGYSKIELLNEG